MTLIANSVAVSTLRMIFPSETGLKPRSIIF